MEKVFPYGEDLFQRPYIVGCFHCRDPSDYCGTQNARHSHIRFLGVYSSHVGATCLCNPSPSGPSTLKSPSLLKGPSTLKSLSPLKSLSILKGPSVSLLSVQDKTSSTRFLTVKLSRSSLGVTVALLLAQQIGFVCYGIYILINCQGRACRAVSRKIPNDHWVPNNPLVLDNPLIRDDCQGEVCPAVLGRYLTTVRYLTTIWCLTNY